MAKTPVSERKRRFGLKQLFLVMLAVAMAASLFFIVRSLSKAHTSKGALIAQTSQPTPTATMVSTPTPLRSLTITAVGDLILHQRQLNDAKQKDGTYDFSNYFTEVTPYINGADISFITLETTLPGGDYAGYPHFRGPDSILDAMKATGFDVVNTCTNHAFDKDWDTIVRTIDTVRAAGFCQVGTNKSSEEYHTPLIVEKNGVKVGVIAYTKNVNGRDKVVSEEQHAYCIRFIESADYARDVQECRDAGADIVVAVLHWGYEYERTPRDSVRAEAKQMCEAGVDLILGSHPHVVQPIETMDVTRTDGSVAHCVVAYSMGNFISNQRDRYTDCGIIFNITFKENEQGNFTVEYMSYIPTYVNRDSGYTDYRVLSTIDYIGNESRLDSLDGDNDDRLQRAWSDITTILESDPAVLVSAP